MDAHSEVEAKFVADNTTLEKLKEFVDNVHSHPVLGPRGYRFDHYKKAYGTDSFYKMGEGVVRYRLDFVTKARHGNDDPYDCNMPYTMFTSKERRSDNNLLNRKEVDLRLDHSVAPEDVEAFMKLMKAEFQYKIKKDYEIWNIYSKKEGVKVCFAMYDVKRPNGSDKRRFVEAEIERESECTAKEGREALQLWITVLREQFGFDAPANVSLYELYGAESKE